MNAYTAAAGATLSYDGNANLQSDGTYTYTHDTENHLLTVTATGHSHAYTYDPLGRRAQKTADGVVTVYLLDGGQEIAEYSGAGALLRRFVFGPGIDEPIATIIAAGAISYHHQDAQGSVIALSDGATGAVGDIYSYGPRGDGASLAGSPFRYTGRRVDAETGLYYYRARYYSPKLGRFLEADPVGYQAGLNLYAYVGNDSINLVDPSGDCPWCIAGAIIGGVAGGIGGGLAGYNATGTWQSVALGAAGGAFAGAAAGVFSPAAALAAANSAATAGGALAGSVAGAATFTVVNSLAGAVGAGAGDVLNHAFAGNSLSGLRSDAITGAKIGAAAGFLEAPFVAAGGGAALGFGALGDAALSVQTALFSVMGAAATTCSVATGCGPAPQPAAGPAPQLVEGPSSSAQGAASKK